MLATIIDSLRVLIKEQQKPLTDEERIRYYLTNYLPKAFSRKDYLHVFKDISTATASRDLKKGIALQLLVKIGDGPLTKYHPSAG